MIISATHKLLASGAVVLLLVGSCVVRDRKIETRGEAKAFAKIEKATDNASNLGKGAAAKSHARGVRGERDPTTRDD